MISKLKSTTMAETYEWTPSNSKRRRIGVLTPKNFPTSNPLNTLMASQNPISNQNPSFNLPQNLAQSTVTINSQNCASIQISTFSETPSINSLVQ